MADIKAFEKHIIENLQAYEKEQEHILFLKKRLTVCDNELGKQVLRERIKLTKQYAKELLEKAEAGKRYVKHFKETV
jgi:hypothetical protein